MSWKSAGVKRSRSYSSLRMRAISFGDRLRRELVENGGRTAAAPRKDVSEGTDASKGNER